MPILGLMEAFKSSGFRLEVGLRCWGPPARVLGNWSISNMYAIRASSSTNTNEKFQKSITKLTQKKIRKDSHSA